MASAHDIRLSIDERLHARITERMRARGNGDVASYLLDLIDSDLDRRAGHADAEGQWLFRQLEAGLAAPESDFVASSADEVIARNRRG